MSNQPPETEITSQLSAILNQLSSLSERVANLEDKLMMVTDVDRYAKLQKLLAAGKFKEADQETTNIMLEVAGHGDRDSLSPEDIQKFPCNAIAVIDRLWLTYSEKSFGFSVQLRIYESLGGSLDNLRTQDTKILQSFATQVGWYANDKGQFDNYDNWNFTLTAPVGCFPAAWWKSPYGLKMVTYFFTRLINCDL